MSKKTGQRPKHLLASLSGANRAYLEDLFARSQQDPSNLSTGLAFASLPDEPALSDQPTQGSGSKQSHDVGKKQAAVLRLINAYRTRGHNIANTDPLGITIHPLLKTLIFHSRGFRRMTSRWCLTQDSRPRRRNFL